jgi:drug/metabolite transporter (DMT)-like permease
VTSAGSTTRAYSSHLLPYLALGISILSLSFSALFVRWANAPGAVASFYRMAVAVAVLAWPFYRRAKSRGTLPRRGLRVAALGGLFFAGDLALWATGVAMSGATNPTILANTAPLWVGLGALLFFREKPDRAFWIGLVLAMAGAFAVLGLDSLRAATLGLGSLFGLLAGVFYGSYLLVTQRGRETLDALTYFWPAALSSTLALLVLCGLFRQPLTGYPTLTYLNFLAMGLISQTIGYLAMNYALGHLPASVVAPTLLGQPAMTAILAGLLLDETLSQWQALGGIAVLAGVYVVHRNRRQS